MNTDTFTIDQIDIKIDQISPKEILPSHSGFTDYIKTITVKYVFKYVDATMLDDIINLNVSLDIDIMNNISTTFIDFDNISKSMFYDLATTTAQTSQPILDTVKFVRVRTGLDIVEPRKIHQPKRLKSFN